MPYVITDEYGYITEDSSCWDCKYAYTEDIWFEWMCKAKKCPYQTENESVATKRNRKEGEVG